MDQNNNKILIICRVKKVIYNNKENGYSVLSVVSDTENAPFSICGALKGMPEGAVLHCQGEWREHVMYGRQFIVESWEKGEVDEVKNYLAISSRANSRPVYRTWGAFLKNNPDIAAKVKYVTEVFLTNVERDYDNANSYGYDYSVNVTAGVKAIYYAVLDGQKYTLLTCTFTVSKSFTEQFHSKLSGYQIVSMIEDGELGDYARSYSSFYDINDFDGLCKLDFRASGVPVCEDEMIEEYYKIYFDDSDEYDDDPDEEPDDELDDEPEEYTIDDIKFDLELALGKAFSDAGIDYEDGTFQCTSMFSRNKLSSDFF